MENYFKNIEKRLGEKINFEKLEIIDNSHKHRGHKFFSEEKSEKRNIEINFKIITSNKEKMEKLTHGDITDFVDIANNVLDGLHDSNVGKATHYYADYIKEPKWAEGKTPIVKIGTHSFYEDID